jgi:hypothetical protein
MCISVLASPFPTDFILWHYPTKSSYAFLISALWLIFLRILYEDLHIVKFITMQFFFQVSCYLIIGPGIFYGLFSQTPQLSPKKKLLSSQWFLQVQPTRCNVIPYSLLLSMLYIFQAVSPPIIRSLKTVHTAFGVCQACLLLLLVVLEGIH